MEYQCCFGIVFFINIAIKAEVTLVRCIHMDNDLSVAVSLLFAPLRRRSRTWRKKKIMSCEEEENEELLVVIAIRRVDSVIKSRLQQQQQRQQK